MTATEITPEAAQLLEYLNTLDRWPTWEEMSRRGVELVDNHGVFSEVFFHLATGEMLYPTNDGWDVLVDPAAGVQVQSGSMTRRHSSGISPQARIHLTATVDPTARVESGAVIGPRAVIKGFAHIGRDAHIGTATFVSAGAFVGSQATMRSGCQVGEGAVIGTGCDVGSTTRIGGGARLAQGTVVPSLEHVGAHEEVMPVVRPRATRARLPGALHAVERLLSMDRG